jgi:hypothetical protein
MMCNRAFFRRASLIFVLALCAPVAPAVATDFTWTGFLNNSWATSTNWLPPGVPGAGDTVLFGPAAQRNISLDGDRTVDAVTFNSPQAYTLNGASDTLTVGNVTVMDLGDVDHTLNTDVTLNANATWAINGNSTAIILNGSLGSNFNLTQQGGGILLLEGNNNGYGGDLSITNGAIVANGGNALSDSGQVTVGASGELSVNADETVGAIAGSGEIDIDFFELTIAGSESTAFSGLLDGVVDSRLIHAGSGSLSLSRAAGNNFEKTIINDGTVRANNTSGSATGTDGVDVNFGGTLRGSGSAAGTVDLDNGSSLTPGAASGTSIGILTVDAVVFNFSAGLHIQLNGTTAGSGYDRLNVIGSATLDGLLNVTIPGSFNAMSGDSFIILTAGSISGTFGTVNFPSDGNTWAIDYDSGTVTICIDSDGDGVCDTDDICPGFDDSLDSDSDGVPNGCDICPGFNDTLDTDGDGVPNGCDVCPGFDDNVDTDTDGVPDGCDSCPLDFNDDSDGDGVCDSDDICPGFDDTLDSDGDTVPDGCDVCPGNNDFPVNITQNTQHATIQAAIDASSPGDIIELDACTFNERLIILNNRDITLRGAGPGQTIIDGQGVVGSILKLQGGDESTFEGFTLRNGVADSFDGGGAVLQTGSTTTSAFRDCIFDGNDSGGAFYGAISVEEGDASFERCVFRNNTTTGEALGTAVGTFEGATTFINCLFEGDRSGDYVLFYQGNNSPATGSVVNCTFADFDGSQFIRANLNPSTVSVVNSVFDGSADAVRAVNGASITVSRSLYPGATGDNIDGGATFVDAPGGDYRLAASSLGIDAGNNTAIPAGVTTDLDGNTRFIDDLDTTDTGTGGCAIVDTGAYEFQATGSDGDDDGDGVCNRDDLCEGGDDAIDSDGDTVPDACDLCSGFDDSLDDDGDGVPDGCDICPGSDDSGLDGDGDGVPDSCDICPGSDDTLDADNDGVPDGCDLCPGFDDTLDGDGDGIPDGCDTPSVHNITQLTDHFTIQTAIDAAVSGDTIEADPGTYNEAIDFNGKSIIVRSSSDDPNNTIIDGSTVSANNVVRCVNGEDPNTLLQGFTITGGNATGGQSVGGRGGGMVIFSSNPTVVNCHFTGNSAAIDGGGLYILDGNSEISSCHFTANIADSDGGGLGCVFSNPVITNCSFSGNVGVVGGGLSLDSGSDGLITQCTFSENTALLGGGIYSLGNSDPTIVSCTFSGNTATDVGGGVFILNGDFVISDCLFNGNTAANEGGGMSIRDTVNASMFNCVFHGNTATDGGGIHVGSFTDPVIVNTIFSGNTASNFGGGLFASVTTNTDVINCTFSANAASTRSGGIYNSESNTTIINSIFWRNFRSNNGNMGSDDQVFNAGNTTSSVNYSLVQGGWSGHGGVGIVNADPLFGQNPDDGGDGYGDNPSTGGVDESLNDNYGDLHLQTGSPAIDAGEPDALPADIVDLDADSDTAEQLPLDMDLRLRRVDDLLTADTGGSFPTVDMGAYEFACTGNLNDISAVTLEDFALFNQQWMATDCGLCSGADFDDDNDVTTADLMIQLANWLCGT